MITETKQRIELNKGEYLSLLLLARLKRVLARLKNKVTERTFRFLVRSGNPVTLDTSKTEYKLAYGAGLVPVELVYQDQLCATVVPCDNPRTVDIEYLKDNFPKAYAACVNEETGRHLRFNIKK